MQSTETPSVTRLGAEETRRTFPPRRRLNDEQTCAPCSGPEMA